MQRRGAALILASLLAVVVFGQGASSAQRRATVTRVIDGDTVEASLGNGSVDIRLLGVDTPETVHPTEPVECFGPEASSFTKRKLEGEGVRLEFDVERYDRYDRTLAYIWLNGRLFNRTLVLRGFATVLIYPPNDKYADRLERAQGIAQDKERGLWEACKLNGDGGSGDGNGGGGGSGRCDPSYPDFCIPPPPPDLDCADVDGSNFAVVGKDSHGFDGDNDGVGCET